MNRSMTHEETWRLEMESDVVFCFSSWKVATVLDPRFKHLKCLARADREAVWRKLSVVMCRSRTNRSFRTTLWSDWTNWFVHPHGVGHSRRVGHSISESAQQSALRVSRCRLGRAISESVLWWAINQQDLFGGRSPSLSKPCYQSFDSDTYSLVVVLYSN